MAISAFIIKGRGKSLKELLSGLMGPAGFCVSLDNQIKELSYVLTDDRQHQARPLDCHDPEATKIYEASLRFLVGMAMDAIQPELRVVITYGVSRSLFLSFYRKGDGKIFKADRQLQDRLSVELRKLVKADLPFVKKTLSKDEALALYGERGLRDRLDSLACRDEKQVHLYYCKDYFDYPYSCMVPSTGYLSRFRLNLVKPGIALCYPRYDQDGQIPPLTKEKNYGKALRRNLEWSQEAGLDTIAKLNQALLTFGPVALISMSEAYADSQLDSLCQKILAKGNDIKFICVAGPSSSSKTTFAKKLRAWLMSFGLRPIRISIDDYYLPQRLAPHKDDGKPDLESVHALDLKRFDKDMASLARGEATTIPEFDFTRGYATKSRVVKPLPGQPVIMEGIHALNPLLTPSIPDREKFNVFISPQGQLAIDDHNPMSLTDNRLIRRIVRDSLTRATSAERTILMWPGVREGEFKYIYPFEDQADFVFNSFLSYETCALKDLALPLLAKVPKDSPAYPTATRLTKFLGFFPSLDARLIPNDSLIREFIGGSCFDDQSAKRGT